MQNGRPALFLREPHGSKIYADLSPHHREEFGRVLRGEGYTGRIVACELVESCLIVAPHPDDETIGAAIWMDRHRETQITLLHITDGSPRDGAAARKAGFSSRDAYAAQRRGELRR